MTAGQPARVLVVLSDEKLPPHAVERIERLVTRYFPQSAFDLTFATPGNAAQYANAFGGTVQTLRDSMLSGIDVLVISETLLDQVQVPPSVRLYALEHDNWRVMVRVVNQPVDARDFPLIDAHVFNRNGPRGGNEHWEFLPYGYMFRECAVGGPIDAFGFRIDEDLAILRGRDPSHKLVVVLGGSAAWSWYALHEETFSERLETKLRERTSEVTVLNYGQGGAVVLHEMITWMVHVERLRPDVVITHDGFNDMHYGMMADPYLLSRSICAPYEFELWGQILHERFDVPPRFDMYSTLRPINNPRQIVQGYIERKKQFERWIVAAGARHIAALQPYALSKPQSPIETGNLKNPRYVGLFSELRNRTPQLYEQFSAALESSGFTHPFNLHTHFGRFDADTTMFQDYVHTTPAGDDAIAEAYAGYIESNGLMGT